MTQYPGNPCGVRVFATERLCVSQGIGNWGSHAGWAPCMPRCSLHLGIVRGMEVGARITAKGQVTIPAAVRRALDLDKGDEVIFEVDLGPGTPHAQVRKAADFMALAGSVPVPAKWADAEWPSVRAAAWSAQAERHDDPA